MARQILIIANPAAGRTGRSVRRLRRVVAEVERLGCTVTLRHTGAPGDAERLAREAEPGFDLIVAAGGDGTVNEVVNGLHGASIPLAVLPLGTGNVLAHVLRLPRAPEALARVVVEAPALPVWPGRVGNRLFVATTGVGFDAEVVGALDHRLKRRLGKLAFAWAILLSLARYRRRSLIVRADGGIHRAGSVIIVKGPCYAGPFVIAPKACLAEPLLYVMLFQEAGRLVVLGSLIALVLGLLPRLPGVATLAARSVSIAAEGPEEDGPALAQIDGDLAGSLPVSVEIAQSPLLLVVPAPPGTSEFYREPPGNPLV